MSKTEAGFNTRAIHAGNNPEPMTGAVNVPIFLTSTYAQEEIGKHKGYEYSRVNNPTRDALEENLRSLEGGTSAHVFASGMAAIHALCMMMKSGDHVVCGHNVYGGTPRLFDSIIANYGIEFTYVDASDLGALDAAIKPNTKLVHIETPTNPLMVIVDLRGAAEVCHKHGVELFAPGATGNSIEGNVIGADVTGTKALGNLHDGVFIIDAPDNTVGGDASSRNLISGNAENGVRIDGELAILPNPSGNIPNSHTTGNKVQANFIGVDATGSNKLKNGQNGIYIFGAPKNVIGGTGRGAGNLVSGNSGIGVFIFGASASGNLVQGNLIGTDRNGNHALGNGAEGVHIFLAPGNTVGATVAAGRNVISANTFDGVLIEGPSATGNLIQGNYIGTDINGTAALHNACIGIGIGVGASGNIIGGINDAARNVISGNAHHANNADVGFGLLIVGAGAESTGNIIIGNYIGVDATGTQALANAPPQELPHGIWL